MSQAIREPWGLSVFGAGTVRTEPELVRLKLAVDVVQPQADLAFGDAGQAVARLRETLRRHEIPDGAVSASRLSLSSEFSGYGAERRFLGYRCQSAYVIETTALDDLQQLIIDAVDAGANRVDEVVFDVRDKPALRDEARVKAVAAARRKAELYAEAAGVALGPVLHIQDVDAGSWELTGHRGHGGGGGASTGDFAPGMVEVHGAVLLGFELVR